MDGTVGKRGTQHTVNSPGIAAWNFSTFKNFTMPFGESVAVGTIIADGPAQIRTGATHVYGSCLGFWLQSEARDKDAARVVSAAKPGLAGASGPRQAVRSDCAFSAHATSIDLPVPEIALVPPTYSALRDIGISREVLYRHPLTNCDSPTNRNDSCIRAFSRQTVKFPRLLIPQ